MRLLTCLASIVLVGAVSGPQALAEPDRASELEAWLRAERVLMVRASNQRLVLERQGGTVFCARAHDPSAPVCVVDHDPTVHELSVDLDDRGEGTLRYYCLGWRDDRGVEHEARWDREHPGTNGPCVEDFSDRSVGRAGLFAQHTTDRGGLFASPERYASGGFGGGMPRLEESLSGTVCFAPPSGWVCTSSRDFFLALAGGPESFTPISGTERYLVHTVEPHSHTQHHSLVLLVFEAGEVRVLDRLALGWTLVLGMDPGPRFTWQREGDVLTLTPRAAVTGERDAPRGVAPRYRLGEGRFEVF
jgi:hypothetical protein